MKKNTFNLTFIYALISILPSKRYFYAGPKRASLTQTYFRLSLVSATSDSRKYVCVRRLKKGQLKQKLKRKLNVTKQKKTAKC